MECSKNKELYHTNDDDQDQHQDSSSSSPHHHQIVWRNVLVMATLHLWALYGLYALTYVRTQTVWFISVLMILSALGVQVGAHRLWSHRAFSATTGLRLFLALCHVLALQNDLYEWCRDHRAHHKFSDTSADPHNSTRGFFFSHIGWLLVRKHSEVKRCGATISMKDLVADPVVRFQRRYYVPLVVVIWATFPTLIPMLMWNESAWLSVTCCVVFRYVYSLNVTWLVNSWAHRYGTKPYDRWIAPVEATTIRHTLMGEGFHNYHHTFPWDYSASELGPWDVFNPATAFIDFFHACGWAYNLKRATPTLVMMRRRKMVINRGGDDDEAQLQQQQTEESTSINHHQFYDGGKKMWWYSTLYEWSTGMFCAFMPVIILRWIFRFAIAGLPFFGD